MYHIGKVKRIIPAKGKGLEAVDSSIQAMVQMFDDAFLNVAVHPLIQEKIKVGDYVLIRFAQPEEIIIKILPKKLGEELFAEFKKMFESRTLEKKARLPVQTINLEIPAPLQQQKQEKQTLSGMVR